MFNLKAEISTLPRNHQGIMKKKRWKKKEMSDAQTYINGRGRRNRGGRWVSAPTPPPSFRPPSALCLYCRNKNKYFSKAPPWIYKSSYGPEYWRQAETLLKGPSNPIRPWVHIFITNPGWSLWNEPSAVVPIHSIDSTYYQSCRY